MPRRHIAYAVQVRLMGTSAIRTLHQDTDYGFVLSLYQRVSRARAYREADVWLVGPHRTAAGIEESVIVHRRPQHKPQAEADR